MAVPTSDPDYPPPTGTTLDVEAEEEGLRLDHFLVRKMPSCSRARLQRWIKAGLVQVNQEKRQPHYHMRKGDRVAVSPPEVQRWHLAPEPIPLKILYEDEDLLALNKPPGLTVHPGAGQSSGTLVNALLHHCPDLGGIGDVQRPGLVHRLDKDTSGVMVVAKTERAHQALIKQFKNRQVDKRYLALVWGRFSENQGEIEEEIGRHPTQRHKMAVTSRRGRPAATSWRRLQEYPGPFSWLELKLHTGRTHQIRVHLSSLGHPVVGDKIYGAGDRRLLVLPPELTELRPLVRRQALHAWKLRLKHPCRDFELDLEAPLPEDLQKILDFLEQQRL